MNYDIDQMHFLVVNIGKAYCKGNWNYKDICSPFTRIYYITKGKAQIKLPESTQELHENRMYIIPAFTRHSCICHNDFEHYYIHIYNESDHDILEDWNLPTEIRAGKHSLSLISQLHSLCPDMELKQTDPQYYDNQPSLVRNIMKNKQRELYVRIISRGIIYQLLAGFLREAQPKHYVKDERITQVLNYIRTHINDKPCIETLAGLSCLSKDHLIRLFKKEMKITPLCYINRKKIEKAQLRLVTETTPVKEIAFQMGFEDQTYFNRLFKKTTGLTPTNYRKSHHETE